MNPTYLTVTALTKYIKYKLETDEHLKTVLLRGEISNLTKHSRGHFYFSLKDEQASIRAIMFSSATRSLNFSPKEGDKVLVAGSISLYEPQGSYSIAVYTMELDGIGALYLAYEQLKEALEKQGYFEPSRKKPIPAYPSAIGVITSPTGAAIKDILHTIERRYPLAKVIIYPALVQGENAKESIVAQIKKANDESRVDVLIVGRGGGSIEDLWAFNERVVAEAIYQSNIPIISAVGHETDFTIADFVSDLRAPTPTAAAELATPDKRNLIEYIESLQYSLTTYITTTINESKLKLIHLDERLDKENPAYKLKESTKRLTEQNYQLKRNYQLLLDTYKHRVDTHHTYLKTKDITTLVAYKYTAVDTLVKHLNHHYESMLTMQHNVFNMHLQALKNLNPVKLMDLGYSITLKDNKRLSSIEEVDINEEIHTKLKDGQLISRVIKKEH